MTRQIFLFTYNTWADVIQETPRSYFAIDIDGVTVCVIKDGMQQVRLML